MDTKPSISETARGPSPPQSLPALATNGPAMKPQDMSDQAFSTNNLEHLPPARMTSTYQAAPAPMSQAPAPTPSVAQAGESSRSSAPVLQPAPPTRDCPPAQYVDVKPKPMMKQSSGATMADHPPGSVQRMHTNRARPGDNMRGSMIQQPPPMYPYQDYQQMQNQCGQLQAQLHQLGGQLAAEQAKNQMLIHDQGGQGHADLIDQVQQANAGWLQAAEGLMQLRHDFEQLSAENIHLRQTIDGLVAENGGQRQRIDEMTAEIDYLRGQFSRLAESMKKQHEEAEGIIAKQQKELLELELEKEKTKSGLVGLDIMKQHFPARK